MCGLGSFAWSFSVNTSWMVGLSASGSLLWAETKASLASLPSPVNVPETGGAGGGGGAAGRRGGGGRGRGGRPVGGRRRRLSGRQHGRSSAGSKRGMEFWSVYAARRGRG